MVKGQVSLYMDRRVYEKAKEELGNVSQEVENILANRVGEGEPERIKEIEERIKEEKEKLNELQEQEEELEQKITSVRSNLKRFKKKRKKIEQETQGNKLEDGTKYATDIVKDVWTNNEKVQAVKVEKKQVCQDCEEELTNETVAYFREDKGTFRCPDCYEGLKNSSFRAEHTRSVLLVEL